MKAKRGLLVVLAVVVGGAAVAGAAAAYYWQRATAIPTWYVSGTANSDLAANVSSGSSLLQNKLAIEDNVRYLSDRQIEITFTETELNQLIQQELSQTPETASLLESTQGLKANIEDDQLQAGVVVNPAELPIQDLPAETQDSLQQALDSLPFATNRELYIGITGNPRIENGQLVLGDDTRLQVGNVQLSTADVARMLGLSPAQLTEQINTALSQTGITLESLELGNDQVILRGTTE